MKGNILERKEMTEKELDALIDFVLKDAFEGLTDSDQYSVEKSIRTWFKDWIPPFGKRDSDEI